MDPTSVMGKRIGAYVIDAIIGTIVAFIAFFALADRRSSPIDLCGLEPDGSFCIWANDTMYIAEDGTLSAILAISVLFWIVGFGMLMGGLLGWTPGKLIVGLRVVDEHGNRASFGKHAARSIMWFADGQPLGIPLVGLIAGVSSKGHRRVGDMVAKTFVVDKDAVGRPVVVPGMQQSGSNYTPPPPGVAPPPGAPAPGTINPPEAFTAPVDAPPSDGVSAPKWDTDRNAYIQWDPELSQWMEFDEAAQQWVPISQ